MFYFIEIKVQFVLPNQDKEYLHYCIIRIFIFILFLFMVQTMDNQSLKRNHQFSNKQKEETKTNKITIFSHAVFCNLLYSTWLLIYRCQSGVLQQILYGVCSLVKVKQCPMLFFVFQWIVVSQEQSLNDVNFHLYISFLISKTLSKLYFNINIMCYRTSYLIHFELNRPI